MTSQEQGIFLLGLLVAMAAPALAQCDPSHAVVAIASILSTLAVVVIILIGVYFFVRWRRQGHKLPRGREKNRRAGHENRGYTDTESNGTLRKGVTPSKRTLPVNGKEQVLPRKNKNELIWPHSQGSGKHERWQRGSSNVSLDEGLNLAQYETISVTLESQDIIGLGFNIVGSYGDGIHISEVHNRGPAKESGLIKTGDQILSVTVSFRNIVYEDALTILSYASPYPVKIHLQKSTDDNVDTFIDGDTQTEKRRIKHPLYHSRSFDTVKSSAQSQATRHRKRAITDLKLGSFKHLFSKHGNNSKKRPVVADNTDGATPTTQSLHRQGLTENNRELDVYSNAQVTKTHTEHNPTDFYINDLFQGNPPGKQKVVSAAVVEFPKTKSDEEIYKKLTPDKPERKNRRQSEDSSNNMTSRNDQPSPSTTRFSYLISAVTNDEIDVDEALTISDGSTWDSSGDESVEQVEEAGGDDMHVNVT